MGFPEVSNDLRKKLNEEVYIYDILVGIDGY